MWGFKSSNRRWIKRLFCQRRHEEIWLQVVAVEMERVDVIGPITYMLQKGMFWK